MGYAIAMQGAIAVIWKKAVITQVRVDPYGISRNSSI